MSGSAKKRREKERGKERRERARNYRAAEMAIRNTAARASFMELVNMPHDRVPVFMHETVFVGIDPGKEIL